MTCWHRSNVCRLAALVGLSFIAGNIAQAQTPAPFTIRYGVQVPRSIQLLPQTIADREGFFAREGIKFEVVPFTSSPDVMQNDMDLIEGLKKGDIHMTVEAIPFLAAEVQKGSPFVGVATGWANHVIALVSVKDVKTYADLKGKVLSVPVAHDTITLVTLKLLEKHGLKPNDVQIRYIGGGDRRLECMKAGQCAAGPMSIPGALAPIAEGYNQLGIENEEVPSLSYVEIVERSWAAAHRDQVVRYIRALDAACRFFNNPANHEKIVKTAMDITGQSEDRIRRLLAFAWDPKNHVIPPSAKIDIGAFNAMMDMTREYKALPAPIPSSDTLMDLTYAKAAGVQ